MWRGQTGTSRALANRSTDAQFLPQAAGHQHDAKLVHRVDLDRGNLAGAGNAIPGGEHAVDAADQPLKRGAVELIGTTEVVHDAGLCTSCVWVPDAFCERVVGDR